MASGTKKWSPKPTPVASAEESSEYHSQFWSQRGPATSVGEQRENRRVTKELKWQPVQKETNGSGQPAQKDHHVARWLPVQRDTHRPGHDDAPDRWTAQTEDNRAGQSSKSSKGASKGAYQWQPVNREQSYAEQPVTKYDDAPRWLPVQKEENRPRQPPYNEHYSPQWQPVQKEGQRSNHPLPNDSLRFQSQMPPWLKVQEEENRPRQPPQTYHHEPYWQQQHREEDRRRQPIQRHDNRPQWQPVTKEDNRSGWPAHNGDDAPKWQKVQRDDHCPTQPMAEDDNEFQWQPAQGEEDHQGHVEPNTFRAPKWQPARNDVNVSGWPAHEDEHASGYSGASCSSAVPAASAEEDAGTQRGKGGKSRQHAEKGKVQRHQPDRCDERVYPLLYGNENDDVTERSADGNGTKDMQRNAEKFRAWTSSWKNAKGKPPKQGQESQPEGNQNDDPTPAQASQQPEQPKGHGRQANRQHWPNAAAHRRHEMAVVQFQKSWDVLGELFDDDCGWRVWDILSRTQGGFRFLDLGAAPGGFSARLLQSAVCNWGVGVTLPPDVGFPFLLNEQLTSMRYAAHFVNLMDLGPRYLSASALGCQKVDLCLCDGQNLCERHGDNGVRRRGGFVGDNGGSYEDEMEPWGDLQPRVSGLGIWALLLHQIGLSLSQLADTGCLIFRFSWVLSIYETVQECDKWYVDATTQIMHLLVECFDKVDVFKSTKYHTSDGTCYVVCSGFLFSHFQGVMATVGGVEKVFARSALEILNFVENRELPTASCLNVLPPPTESQVMEIRSLLEKVALLREIARMKKGLSSGSRFEGVSETQGNVGKVICRSNADRLQVPESRIAEQDPMILPDQYTAQGGDGLAAAHAAAGVYASQHAADDYASQEGQSESSMKAHHEPNAAAFQQDGAPDRTSENEGARSSEQHDGGNREPRQGGGRRHDSRQYDDDSGETRVTQRRTSSQRTARSTQFSEPRYGRKGEYAPRPRRVSPPPRQRSRQPLERPQSRTAFIQYITVVLITVVVAVLFKSYRFSWADRTSLIITCLIALLIQSYRCADMR